MEEIDIIELLKRVRGGNAPEKIEINDVTYEIVPNAYVRPVNNMYMVKGSNFKTYWEIGNLDTKIKILDKPIIEELKGNASDITDEEAFNKINEIIRHINKEEK